MRQIARPSRTGLAATLYGSKSPPNPGGQDLAAPLGDRYGRRAAALRGVPAAARLDQQIDAYDRRRAAAMPYRRQRVVERFGEAEFYGWSEDKARQYAEPLRADFGAF